MDVPRTMRAIALRRFGGIDALEPQTLPVPSPGPHEVLVDVAFAAVGEWDAFEREGGYARLLGTQATFPYVLGSEGAGVAAAVGERVDRFRVGDRVYAVGFLNPRGGFYAEYAAVREDLVASIPGELPLEQAAALGGVGITALRGIEDVLGIGPGESVLVFGASGGVGHVAVQLARRIGARVLAVASGRDGVRLARRLGADAAVDGRSDDILSAARAFAPDGLDAVLLTAGGETAQQALSALREGGRVAFPYGIHPEPTPTRGARVQGYYADPDQDIIERLNRVVASGPFEVHIAEVFPLDRAAEAHEALGRHYLGKLVLRVD